MGTVQAGRSNHRNTASRGQSAHKVSSLARAFSLWRAPLCERCQSWEGGREGGKGGHWWAQPQSVVSRRSLKLAATLQETCPTAPKLRRRHGPRDLLQTHIPGPQTYGDLGWGPLGRQHRENLGSGPGVRLLWCGCGQPHGPDDGKGLTGTALGSSLLPAGTNRGRGRWYCSPGHSCHLVTALDSVPGPVPGPSLCHDPVR